MGLPRGSVTRCLAPARDARGGKPRGVWGARRQLILLVEVESDVFKLWVRFDIYIFCVCVSSINIPFRLVSSRRTTTTTTTPLCVSARGTTPSARHRTTTNARRKRESARDETLLRATLGRSLSFFVFRRPSPILFFADGADDARCNSNLLWEMRRNKNVCKMEYEILI